jgi:hypothetical protein
MPCCSFLSRSSNLALSTIIAGMVLHTMAQACHMLKLRFRVTQVKSVEATTAKSDLTVSPMINILACSTNPDSLANGIHRERSNDELELLFHLATSFWRFGEP